MRARLLALLVIAACAPGLDASPPDAGTVAPPTSDAQSWLDAQNAVRRAPQPAPASPLPPFTWSLDAAAVARSWANGCVYQHNSNRGQRGENIAASSPGYLDVPKTVAAWAGEAADYDYQSNTCASGKECGHYTQLVWRDTARAGCAQARCHSNSPFGAQFPDWDFFVCDYEPPGNYIGQRPY
jgi:pathogenesis-related protein 1